MEGQTVKLRLAQGNFDVIFTGSDVLDPATNKTAVIHRFPNITFSKEELVKLCNYVIEANKEDFDEQAVVM